MPSSPRLIAFGAADASLWFVITLAYAEQLIGKHLEFRQAASHAMLWLKYQDAHEEGLIEQQESTDWMDIIANRGHVLYTNVLYFAALELYGDIKRAHLVREAMNGFLWSPELGYFRPWVWKQEHGDWFDTAANLFAVAFSLADDEQTASILDYIERNHLDEPHPIRTMHPPIQPGDKDWREYYRTEHELNLPDQYHNGGSWPWVGGLYVAALVQGRATRAGAGNPLQARADKPRGPRARMGVQRVVPRHHRRAAGSSGPAMVGGDVYLRLLVRQGRPRAGIWNPRNGGRSVAA